MPRTSIFSAHDDVIQTIAKDTAENQLHNTTSIIGIQL